MAWELRRAAHIADEISCRPAERAHCRPDHGCAAPGKLAWSVLSSLTEFPIRSGPYAGLEIASLHIPT